MNAAERLLQYVQVYTTSDEDSSTVPTAPRELDLAKMLAREMRELGIQQAEVSETGYVYGRIPATPGLESVPPLGLIAHMDTAPDFCGQNVRPQVHPQYDGQDLPLGSSGRVLSVKAFPELAAMRGKTLITTDGTTLLGADDKAGIAEILTACERLLTQNLPHGSLCIAFTPDEEVGRGADHFDQNRFGARFAYTVDGGAPNEISYENFYAAQADFTFHGLNVHPGEAKGKMKNAVLLAIRAHTMLPSCETPAQTQGREGFFHLCKMDGTVEKAHLQYIVRDHSKAHFEIRKEMLQKIADTMNEQFGSGTAELSIQDQYANMLEFIRPYPQLIEHVRAAMKELGVTPCEAPIRGGTDGAKLSEAGLPCPNLGTGGYAFHGPYEHICAEDMELCVKILLGVIHQFAASEKM